MISKEQGRRYTEY